MTDPRLAVSATGRVARFHELGVLTWADVHPAQQICALYGDANPDVALACALTIRALRGGSVCLELDTVREASFETDDEAVVIPADAWPDPVGWMAALNDSPAVSVGADGPPDRPLRLVGNLLYLERYWAEEERVRAQLIRRRDTPWALPDLDAVAARLDVLFGTDADPRQRAAAAHTLISPITVIAGGPGTGKTTTIARILAVLLAEGPVQVALAAPTGKAAARMDQALRTAAAQLPSEAAAALVGVSASTLHRLLGWTPDSRNRFVHNAENPLPHDVVVVDELSMVSLTLMSRLLEAVGPHTRLVLVGDPDQLASVEAGAVLGDITGATWTEHPGRAAALGRLAPGATDGPVIQLRHNYRFDGAIGELARAIRDGDADTAERLLTAGHPQITLSPDAGGLDELRDRVVGAGRAVYAAALAGDAQTALAALDSHRLLCAHRRGPHGVSTLARRAEHWLRAAIPGFGAEGEWYTGRPLLVTKNSSEWGLYNGDTGVVMSPDGRPRVFFGGESDQRSFSPYLLAGAQTVFAMTVHRAQGSQFDEVSFVVPAVDSPLLTRELLYTAVTRATTAVHVIGDLAAVRKAIGQPARRASGLRDRL